MTQPAPGKSLRRIVIGLLIGLSVLVVGGGLWALKQFPTSSPDPMKARLITSDIPNFWRAYDKADSSNAAAVFQRDYLDHASPGLADFRKARIGSAKELATVVMKRRRFFDSIRPGTMSLDTASTIRDSVYAAFRKMKELYPEAKFPDVYFVIGRLSSGGITSGHGLLIGVEINARDSTTPVDELSSWERAVTGRLSDLPHIVAHELVHVQQPFHIRGRNSLLTRSLGEGSADFIAELVSGAHTNRGQHAYGDAHERELWLEFHAGMHGSDTRRWLYNGDASRDRPADLGYYEGYKIAEAYYMKATDKKAAIKEIIRMPDPEKLLRESGYGSQWIAGPVPLSR